MSCADELKVDIPKVDLDSPNEESVNTPVSSLNGEERVLMERDGKFELIKAREIEAAPLHSTAEPIAEKHSKHTLSKPSPPSSQSKTIDISKTSQKESRKILRTPNRTVPRKVAPTSSHPSHSVQGLSAVNSASSLTQPKRSRPSTQPHIPIVSPSKTQARLLTAPLDYRASSSLCGAQDSARRELAQEAFRAWLDMKDRQLIEESKNRTDRARNTNNPDTDKRKTDAYQAWMENKRNQVLTEIGAKNKKQSINLRNKKKLGSKTTFNKWLKKKSSYGSKNNFSTVALTSFRKQNKS